jgi:hypothetical protein
MSYCTKCGHPRSGATRFCTACGGPLPTQAEPATQVADPADGGPATTGLDDPAATATSLGYAGSGNLSSGTTEARHASPGHTSPGHASPGHASPGHASPGHASPGHTSPGYASPGHTGADYAGPGYNNADYTSPGNLSSGTTGARHASPGYTSPGHASPGHASPGHASPGHASPGYTSPGAGRAGPPDLLTPSPSPSPQRGKIIAAIVVAVVILAGGGGTAYYLTSRHHGGSALADQTTHASVTPPASAGPAASPATASQTPTLTPTPTPAATFAPAGSGFVAVGPAASQSADLPGVEAWVNRYFGAINHHAYRRYRALLSPGLQQSESAADFASGYRSTTDAAATLTAISDLGDGEVGATLNFTSHQLPADSPTSTACDRWHVTLYLSQVAGGYELDPAPAGYHARDNAC